MKKLILSVLVVDDELPLREELQTYDWEAYGAVLVGKAENGKEALEFCGEYVPDVVIADITMPVMDGFELFKNLKQQYPQIQVILLTCHSDFDYARQALQMGALDYLVKVTLKEHELEEALQKAREVINRERSHSIYVREQVRWERSKLLRHIMKGVAKPDISYIEQLTKELQIDFPYRQVRIHVDVNQEDKLFVDRELQRLLVEMEHSDSFIWVPIHIGEYLLFFDVGNSDVHLLEQQVHRIISVLDNGLDERIPFVSSEVRIMAIVSDCLQNEREWVKNLEMRASWKEIHFYDHDHKVLIGSPHSFSAISSQDVLEMEGMMRRMKWKQEQLIAFIHDDFSQWAKRHRVQPNELKNLVTKWCMDWLNQWGISKHNLRLPSVHIISAATLSELVENMVHFVERNKGSEDRFRVEIRLAKQFIKEHLPEPITLSAVSEEAGLSPPYLSRLFRQEVGESFNEYLTRLRMEEAVRLLQHTNMKVYEVAERVGIPSYRYFSVVFRRWTGTTPKQYRKGVSKCL